MNVHSLRNFISWLLSFHVVFFFTCIGSADTDNPVNRFDFVFLLRLRYADKKSSLAELIVKQHGKLDKEDVSRIEGVIKGKTKDKVLLILDGYDEYKPGTNKEVDQAILYTIGNCFLILTSRPDLPSEKGSYVSKEIRDRMDGEVVIEGFTEESIKKCSSQYLDSEEESSVMLEQATDSGIAPLLKVPIILLMVCVLFSQDKRLPSTQTKLVGDIIALCIDRTVLKNAQLDIQGSLDDLLFSLGELSWKSLQNEVQQLLLCKASNYIAYQKYVIIFTYTF